MKIDIRKASQEKLKDVTQKQKQQKLPPQQPGSGIRSMDSTTLFRITNFELFVKPNKYIMAFGLITMTGCCGYLYYLNQVEKNNPSSKLYTAINDDDTISIRARKSRWD